MRDIILSANNNEEVVVLPIVPDIEINSPQDNEKFKVTGKGYLNLIGEMGLREFSISSIFPAQPMRSMRPGSEARPFLYLDFINKWRRKQVPIRIVASRPDGNGKSREWFNMAVLIDDFQYRPLRNGSVKYTLDLSEYIFIGDLV